ncbi:MAG: hypothetical protein ACPLW9_00745 [Minisyncoccales bacterium]
MKFTYLRKKYPQFIYEKYSWRKIKNNLAISFDFRIKSITGQEIKFTPTLIVKNVSQKQIVGAGEGVLNNLIFNLGLIEMISYWKATCSPEIIIQAGYLDNQQIKWWYDLIIKGMGQFFYENKIDWRIKNFLKIISPTTSNSFPYKNYAIAEILYRRVLVPVSGGKDSIVNLELIKKRKNKKILCFSLNPTNTVREILKIAGCQKPIFVYRTIDPVLLKLNQRGFLNGHTPFSAYLAFLSVLIAVLFQCRSIPFANEKSADEGNVKYLNQIINHQWSKSSEFEKKFQWYSQHYLVKNIKYFSSLRRYSELEIAKMLIKYPQYFSVFSSCNVVLAKKLKKRWCGQCPKCLFVYLLFYPFLDQKTLLKIFNQDLLENKKLLPLLQQLLGKRGFKPFECVGTIKETKKAIQLGLVKAKKTKKIPYLLQNLQI